MRFQGLSNDQAKENQSLGLSNSAIDSYVPGYPRILFKNVFSLINIVVSPLLFFLALFGLYNEVLALSIFLIINTITSVIDEIRIKREIEKLKSQFQLKASVIREGLEMEIPVSEIVIKDVVVAREGEAIVADGKILEASYLQLDESGLTGESDYIRKDEGAQVLSGSFVITGICYYEVSAVGSTNYTNRLAAETTRYSRKKSALQQAGDKMILTLTLSAIALGLLNFGLSYLNPANSFDARLLSLTTIVTLIIPQTLIFLFTLTFSISIAKLFKKGVLVQKGAAIENLTHVDTICMDKTGTITTNRMLLNNKLFWSFNETKFYQALNSVETQLFGVNKTLKLLMDIANVEDKVPVSEFSQIPFNSKVKFSQFSGKILDDGSNFCYVLGAYEVLETEIPAKALKPLHNEIVAAEARGLRTLVVLEYSKPYTTRPEMKAEGVALFIFEEELNFGIMDIIERFRELGISVKIISGDSLGSVRTIANKVGLKTQKFIDLSRSSLLLENISSEYEIFTRAKPEDKVKIIKALQQKGHKVAMVGDGINDVLSLKAANVSIAMESGAKVARNISDIVLLNNDYSRIPDVFFEGDNIVFNLKLSTKMFLAKSIFALALGIVYTFLLQPVPLLPATTLIFSFLGSSLPSYIVIFTRTNLKRQNDFLKEVSYSSLPAGLYMAVVSIILAQSLQFTGLSRLEINTALALLILGVSLVYSLVLLWRSGKLMSFGLALTGFIIAFIAGSMQTILPVDLANEPELALLTVSVVALGAMLLGWFLYSRIRPNTLFKKLFVGFLSIAWIPIVLNFPFRSYYSTTRLDAPYFLLVLLLSAVSVIALTFLDKLADRLRQQNIKGMRKV